MPTRDELKKALDTLRRRDPNNQYLKKFDRQYGSYTTAPKNSAYGSIKLYDNWAKTTGAEEERKKKSSRFVRGSDGGWESKGYQKTIESRGPFNADLTGFNKSQDQLKKKFGIEDLTKPVSYEQAQKIAAKRRKEEEKARAVREKNDAKRSNKNEPNFVKDATKAAAQFFNPFDEVSAEDAVKNFINRKSTKQFDEFARGANRAVDSASLGAMSNMDKKLNKRTPYYTSERKIGEGGGKDMISTGIGYLTPGLGMYKWLNASKPGMALTKMGAQGLKQRLASEAAKGAITGAGMTVAETGVKEGLNPKDQDWKENVANVVMGTTIGAVADPALYGAGKAVGKGAEKAATKIIKKLLPSDEQAAKAIGNVLKDTPKMKPKEYTLPDGKTKIKSRVADKLKEVQSKIEAIQPEKETYDKELQEAMQQQYEYLKNSMGKGVDSGTTGGGIGAGNFKEVDGVFSVSRNPKWYQDFYKQNGRRPNNQELRELAEQHVREGFQDEIGDLPAWKPKAVQELDDQISEVSTLLKENPDQEAALKPILEALEQDKLDVLKTLDNVSSVKGLQEQAGALEKSIQAMQGETIPLREATGNVKFKENMGVIEQAVNAVKKKLGSTNVVEKPITRRELINSMRKNLGVTIRTGRLGNVDESVKGYYKVNPEVIRSRQYGDIQVLSHEIGHHLDKQFKLASEAFDSELMKLGANTSTADYTPEQVRQEGLAEFIRLFLTDPEKALTEAPNFSAHFDEVLPGKVKKGLLRSQADVDRWIEQGPELRLRGKIDRTGKEVETVSEKMGKVYSQFVDKFDYLKKVEVGVKGKLSDATESLYKKARLSVGAPKKAEIVLQDFKKALKPIDKYGYNTKDVGDYVTAVHALELENMGKKVANEAVDEAAAITQAFEEARDIDTLFKSIEEFEAKYDINLEPEQIRAIEEGNLLELTDDQLYLINQANRIESGMTKEEIESAIKKFDSPEMQKVQQDIVAYNNRLLDMLVEHEVISKEAMDAMKEKYPNYVPFYRFFEDDITVGMGGGKGFTNLTNPVKRLQGSFRDVIDPLESMVKNTFAVVNAVEKNKVGLELSKLADIEGAGRFIERLDGAQQVKKEHIVTVFENGEKVQYQLDKDLYETIQQLDEDRANKVIQFLSKPASMLRAGATLTPEFMIRNPIRDQYQAFVVSEYGYNPIIDLPRGAFHVFMGKGFDKSSVYKQWAMEGGGYGNYLSQDRNYLRETLKQMKKEGNLYQRGYKTITNPKELGGLIMRTLQTLSEFSEEATKVGEFRKATKKGATPQEAAYQSRDLMDFGRVGSDMKQWNRAVAFLNANIQGKDKIARAFKKNPVRTTIRSITGVALPAYGAYMSMELLANDKQRETYENTPKWMKDTFFLVPIPGTDVLARIPKPFDLAPMFANPVEQIADYIKGNDPEAWDEFLLRQGKVLMDIPMMLTGLTPVIENITNYSFFMGGPIVPRRDQDLLPQDQYGVNTSLTARTVGNFTKSSPYKVDNLIRGYGAGLGKYATSGLDKVLEGVGAGSLPPQEAKKWHELPVVNAFTVDSTGGGQTMTDFYDTLDQLRKENNSAKRNEVAYEREDAYKYLNKQSREISKLRNEYREIQGSYDLSPAEKREMLDELDRMMNQIAKGALIQIGEKNE